MLAQRPEYGISVGFHGRHLLEVPGRKAAAEIDHCELNAALRAGAENRRRRLERLVPSLRATLLGADVEGHAMGVETEPVGVFKHVDRHRQVAAELARERPLGPGAVEQEAAEHSRARRGPGNLLDLRLAIDREYPDSESEGAGDVTLLLDGVAIRNAVGRSARGKRHLDLGDRSGIETGAEAGKQRQHFRRRVRLDGVEHPRVRQRAGERPVIVAYHLKIDDEARSVVLAAAQKLMDALRHGALPTGKGSGKPLDMGPGLGSPTTRDGDAPARGPKTLQCCLGLDWGAPRSARAAMMNKPLR